MVGPYFKCYSLRKYDSKSEAIIPREWTVKIEPADLIWSIQFSCLVVSNSLWPMDGSTPGLPVHHQLPEFIQAYVHRVSDAIQPSHPLSPPCPLPSVFSSIRVFSNELAPHVKWSKYWSFIFSISPSRKYSGLISFRIDWCDLLALSMWDLCSLTRNRTCIPCIARRILNHWTTREVPQVTSLMRGHHIVRVMIPLHGALSPSQRQCWHGDSSEVHYSQRWRN